MRSVLYPYFTNEKYGGNQYIVVDSPLDVLPLFVKEDSIVVKYPLKQYNAGSTFKNPNGYKSWELINNLGLRGININDALVSDKYCNFLINKNNCRSDDMKKLIELIINTVKNEYNIKLECEWDLINF